MTDSRLALHLPLAVRLLERKCVVIGGGRVAARRAQSLIAAGARVTVVAAELGDEIRSMADRGDITALREPYGPKQIEEAFLVVVATSDEALNARIADEAREAGCLVNDADVPERGDCIIPASARRGRLVFSVTTCGASPSLASDIRDRLLNQYGPEYEAYVDILGESRALAMTTLPDPVKRREALVALARDPQILELARAGRLEEARARATACISSSSD